MRGLNPDPACVVMSRIAYLRAVLFDLSGHRSPVLRIPAFLVDRDDIPLLVGMAGVLEEFQLDPGGPGRFAALIACGSE